MQLTFTLAGERILLSFNGLGTIFEGSQIFIRNADTLGYQPPSASLQVSRAGEALGRFTTPFQHSVVIARRSSVRNPDGSLTETEGRFIGGAPTLAADIPTEEVRLHRTVIILQRQTSSASPFFFANDGRIVVDFTAGTVSGTVDLEGGPGETTSIAFSGQLQRQSGRIVGSVRGGDGATGTFHGRLFGPTGAELGLTFALASGADRSIGFALGRPGA